MRPQVLNWNLLRPLYTALHGIDAFDPAPSVLVESKTHLLATREGKDPDGDEGVYHYFLSGENAV